MAGSAPAKDLGIVGDAAATAKALAASFGPGSEAAGNVPRRRASREYPP
jgi:hypothetical protein